jgi:hypothetical protein
MRPPPDWFARLARLAKTHGSLAPIDPWLTQMMERVHTRAVVDVPKGTVVVGDRRRAPQAGELVEMSRVSAATVSPGSRCRKFGASRGTDGAQTEHVPRRCAQVEAPKNALHRALTSLRVRKVFIPLPSAINYRPAGTASKHSNQRRASSLSSTVHGRMARVPP